MCTSFVYRKDNILIGMNFDNDGKDFRISQSNKNDFMVSVQVNGVYYPSFGINLEGIFVNNLMVDSDGSGKYKRQNDRRWITSSLVTRFMENSIRFDDLPELLRDKEIVNGPFFSTHNMIVNRLGSTCIVEAGKRNIFSSKQDGGMAIMANFPLSDYEVLLPEEVSGSGSERYKITLRELSVINGRTNYHQGFEILDKVKQCGPEWRTDLSLVYLPEESKLYMCRDGNFSEIHEYDFSTGKIRDL